MYFQSFLFCSPTHNYLLEPQIGQKELREDASRLFPRMRGVKTCDRVSSRLSTLDQPDDNLLKIVQGYASLELEHGERTWDCWGSTRPARGFLSAVILHYYTCSR